jgi:C1A family cysteine protease
MAYLIQDVIDLRLELPPVRDQGRRGTCVAFAVTALHERSRGQDSVLSEEFLYGCCKWLDGNNNEGTHVESAVTSLRKVGQAEAALLPYNPTSAPQFKDIVSMGMFRDARRRKVASTTVAPPALPILEKCLSEHRALVTVLEVHPSFFVPKENCIDVTPNESFQGLHAVLLGGYSRRNDGNRYFIMRNSWGRAWGQDGYAYLSYDYYFKYHRGTWVI